MKPMYQLAYTEIPGFLSSTQIAEHYKLYEGYYNQARDLPSKINGIGGSDDPARIRGLQKTLQYALSGRELHEIYFAQMQKEISNYDSDANEKLKQAIRDNFGGYSTFITDLIAAAKTARGWYRLELNPSDNILYHNVGDFHDEGSTSGFVALIALDVYDHAYFYDYQTNKSAYIQKFVEHLNWKNVSERFLHSLQA